MREKKKKTQLSIMIEYPARARMGLAQLVPGWQITARMQDRALAGVLFLQCGG